MMKNKKFFRLAVLLLIPFLSQCQKPYEITQENTARILKTLSADDMKGRQTFSPDIEKAAAFIESEFSSIGIAPLEGLQSFRQSFNVYSISVEESSFRLNGKTVKPENYIIVSDSKSFSWNKDDVTVVSVNKGDNLRQKFSEYSSSKEPLLVLIDAEHKTMFSRYQAFYSRAARKIELGNAANVVFLLSNSSVKSLELSVTNKIDTLEIANIAGKIEGKLKDEYVVFSGHYDHIGIRPAVEGDSIANGANDDASGVTAVIELARHFKSLKQPERTLLFVAFTGEEVGGYGSKYFSKQLNPDEIMAMFNIEMIGKPAVDGPNTAWITGFERSSFGELLQKSTEGSIYTFYPDPYPQQNLFYRSDNATLARLGVPAHSISTTPIDVDPDYHKVSDEFSTIDIPHMTNTIKAIAKAAEGIVSGKDTPTRVDPSEMR